MKKFSYRLLIFVLTISLLLSIPSVKTALALDNSDGSRLFEINCAGCHPQGGNIIRRGKTLQQKALKKFSMDSVEAITAIVTNGKGIMSAFGEKLTVSEIDTIAKYVLEQADHNWQ
jgi:cytochrome c6